MKMSWKDTVLVHSNPVIAGAKREDITLEEAYKQIKDILWLCTIRRWRETKELKKSL